MRKNESQDSYRAAREESKMPMTSNEENSYLVKEGEEHDYRTPWIC